MGKTKNNKTLRTQNEALARALADYHNLAKRVEREKEEFAARAGKSIIEQLLPILDVLQTAQEHLKDDGLEMALGQFRQVLGQAGVERIETGHGDKFDEMIHEAIDTEAGGEQGTVARVATEGYKWKNGIVLRPVKVVVYGEDVEKEKELDKEMTRGNYV